jgi:hypothetical protein
MALIHTDTRFFFLSLKITFIIFKQKKIQFFRIVRYPIPPPLSVEFHGHGPGLSVTWRAVFSESPEINGSLFIRKARTVPRCILI